MKRLVPGDDMTKKTQWWKGYVGRCETCGEQVEMEGNELTGVQSDDAHLRVKCPNPTCRSEISIFRGDPEAQPEGPAILVWNCAPPPGVSFQTHKFTIVDGIESASGEMKTDYTKETETIIVGNEGRMVLCCLPMTVLETTQDGKMKADDKGRAIIGKLGNRQVVYDRNMDDDLIEVVNNEQEKKVTIRIEEHPELYENGHSRAEHRMDRERKLQNVLRQASRKVRAGDMSDLTQLFNIALS